MPSGQEIMARAGVALNDTDYVRWTLPELADWINEAVRAIILAKPSASTSSIALTLAVGTLQKVPASGSPTPLMLQNIVRNLKDATLPRVGGRIITATNKPVLDQQVPYWHDPTKTPYKKEVRQFVFDEANPLEFYCYPGNDGTGVVEAVVSTLPTPLSASGSPDAIGSYAGSIGLPEPYSVPILDYVLYRAQLKDDIAGNAGRAVGHYQAFAAALGIKIKVEGATSPNSKRAST